MTTRRSRVAFLDTLRFTAAAAVVLQHALELNGGWGRAVTTTLSPGVFGVVLFFLVSGFVIPLSVRDPLDLVTFTLRRVFRIMPLALVTFALVAIVRWTGILPGFGSAVPLTARDWIANVLLVQDYVGAPPIWGVTWTLSIEGAWYMLFAASYRLFGKRGDGYLAVAMPIGLVALALGSILAGHRVPLAHLGLVYAAVLGARTYRYSTGDLSRALLLRDSFVFAVCMSVCNVIAFGYFSHPTIAVHQALYPWLAASGVFCTVATVPAVRSSPLLASRFMQGAGMVSFSTYLLHPLAIAACIACLPRELFLAGTAAATLLLSLLGYHLVERPGQRLGCFLIDRSGYLRANPIPLVR